MGEEATGRGSGGGTGSVILPGNRPFNERLTDSNEKPIGFGIHSPSFKDHWQGLFN